MLLKRLAIPLAVGVVIVAVVLVIILAGTKSNHLELNLRIMKARTGALDENSSAAVLDFRVHNTSDVPFMVGQVEVDAIRPDGSVKQGQVISRQDINLVLQYNRFLGNQYNPVLVMRDRVKPHEEFDRMVAARFDLSQNDLEASKALRLRIQDADGAWFESDYKLH
ncbi:MAG TPA: hypothetical protein VFA04_26085 [Bryobacteraceae bacterium]|nr:hypothetical protein [Bryobacteraceae bacterium]